LAALTLKELGYLASDAAGPVTATASDADANVRLIALLTLGEIAPDALEKLGPVKDSAVATLAHGLGDHGQTLDVRVAAATDLGLIGPGSDSVVEVLREALLDGPPPLKAAAVEALGRLGSAAAVAEADLLATSRLGSITSDLKRRALVAAGLVAGRVSPAVLDQLGSELDRVLEQRSYSDETIRLIVDVGEFGPLARTLVPRLNRIRDEAAAEIAHDSGEQARAKIAEYKKTHNGVDPPRSWRTTYIMAAGPESPYHKVLTATIHALQRIGPDPGANGPPVKP
jgi:hypothetical protein